MKWTALASDTHSGREGTSIPQWHLIGHLQRNKLRRTLPLISLLHSLDSPRLAEAIAADGESQNTKHCVLLKSTSRKTPAKRAWRSKPYAGCSIARTNYQDSKYAV
ncbi:MAG: hypothetical protein R3C56_41735 [Pirellulaceae bacterium]